MKLLEILTITAIKKQQGLYKFFDKKLGSGASINEELANKLHQSVTEKLKEEESMRDLMTIFGHQIQLK